MGLSSKLKASLTATVLFSANVNVKVTIGGAALIIRI